MSTYPLYDYIHALGNHPCITIPKLPNTAKVLYSFLLELSKKAKRKNQKDEKGVFVYCSIAQMCETLCCATNTARTALKHLMEHGLVTLREKEDSATKTARTYYVYDLPDNTKKNSRGKRNTRKTTKSIKDVENKTSAKEEGGQFLTTKENIHSNHKSIESNKTVYLKDGQKKAFAKTVTKANKEGLDAVKKQIEYDTLSKAYPSAIRLLDAICVQIGLGLNAKKDRRINGVIVSAKDIRTRFEAMRKEHVEKVIRKMQEENYTVYSMGAYLFVCLQNTLCEENASAYRSLARTLGYHVNAIIPPALATYFSKWLSLVPANLVHKACEITSLNAKGSNTVRYADAIITKWHRNGHIGFHEKQSAFHFDAEREYTPEQTAEIEKKLRGF